MNVYVRAACVPSQPASGPALLLEGSWPQTVRTPDQTALDDWLQPEHRVIDRQAEELASYLARDPKTECVRSEQISIASLADRCALGLRYYLVKLLRTAAYLSAHPFTAGSMVTLRLNSQRDQDYAALLLQATLRDGAVLRIEHANGPLVGAAAPPRQGTGWRRIAGRLNNQVARWRSRSPTEFRSLLCGSPHVLDTVCGALQGRGSQVAWLHHQFVWRTARKWGLRGVQQFLCDAGVQRAPLQPAPALREPVFAYGLDLRPALQSWFETQYDLQGAWQQSIDVQIDRHLRGFAPHAIVVDEDATPLKRALLRAAQRHGMRSLAVQHGVPCVRFGFVPLVADRIAVWGESSREQMLGWGVSADRVAICGCTVAEPDSTATTRPRDEVLLLATVPPRADRPDSVDFGLSVASHSAMLQAAGEAVARRGLRLLVRLHPRTTDSKAVLGPLSQIAGLNFELSRGGSLNALARSVRCVLSCASSSGVQAAALGIPVIQLMPPGGADLLPAAAWGLDGTARSLSDLETLLDAVLAGIRTSSPNCPVFAATGSAAAERVADEVQRLIKRSALSWPTDDSVSSTDDPLTISAVPFRSRVQQPCVAEVE